MKKKYYKSIDYKQLFIATIKTKYINLFLGMFVCYLIVLPIFKIIPKPKAIGFNFIKLTQKSISPSTKKTEPIKTYIVREGDDLWNIAEKFYGSGFNAYDISKTNKLDVNSSIVAGQKLVIPSVKRRQPTVGEISSAATSQVTYTEGKYIVLPGDSLSLISYKVYGDLYMWPKILDANNLQNADQIEVGMTLTIPR